MEDVMGNVLFFVRFDFSLLPVHTRLRQTGCPPQACQGGEMCKCKLIRRNAAPYDRHDLSDDIFDIVQHFFVAKTYLHQPARFKNSSPMSIRFLLLFSVMNSAINLNYQFCLVAEEVGDKSFDDLLPSESIVIIINSYGPGWLNCRVTLLTTLFCTSLATICQL